jgi:hypothetical protein
MRGSLLRRGAIGLSEATLTQPRAASPQPRLTRHHGEMQIDDTANVATSQHIDLGLTEAEARELRDALETLLSESADRHEHVSSADSQQELTVGSPGNETQCVLANCEHRRSKSSSDIAEWRSAERLVSSTVEVGKSRFGRCTTIRPRNRELRTHS